MIWSMFRSGIGDDEIVQRMHTDISEVKSAIVRMEAHRVSIGHEMVDMAVNSMVIRAIQRRGRVLEDAMGAERTLVTSHGVVLNPETRLPYTEPDHATRLEALRTVGGMIRDIRPRGPGVVVQQNNSNTVNVGGNNRSFESLVREAEKRQRSDSSIPVAEEVEEEDEDTAETVAAAATILDGDVDTEDIDTEDRSGVELDDPNIDDDDDNADA